MLDLYDVVKHLTSSTANDVATPRMLNDFAFELGWQPSDQLYVPTLASVANAHLLVEHGLENSAVITFLHRSWRDLTALQQRQLLAISYNNLVDWHIHVQAEEVIYVYNRASPPRVQAYPISRSDIEQLRSQAFEQITGKRPNPNLPALDDALIERISFWRRNLAADLEHVPMRHEALSTLFNTVIFVRAIEDWRRLHATLDKTTLSFRTLLDVWSSPISAHLTLRDALHNTLERLAGETIPPYIGKESLLHIFDNLDRSTVLSLLTDFYRNKYYDYDFSLMSKHALSRIYEHYVAIFRPDESPQLTLPFFTRLPEEERDKAYGSIYTPQFIARFFARYLREQMPPLAFRRIRAIDPSCGSGIFLRTLLELQFEPLESGVTTEQIQASFGNIYGYDVNENACQAARLSLALLHLVLTDKLPHDINVSAVEAIEHFQNYPSLEATFDALLANPPFVSLTTQSEEMRRHVAMFMGDHAEGRVDVYQAFLLLALKLLKPGGYGLFVLPHNFLLSKNALGLRKLLANESWIRCLADLSAIRVFEDTGTYVILLIFQKKHTSAQGAPPAMIIKCQDLVGRALQDAVEGRLVENNSYSIYDVNQDSFAKDEWIILPPTESRLEKRFEQLPLVKEFLEVREGFVSGADDIFLIPTHQVPRGEEAVFAPYLADREMKSYVVPNTTAKCFFYPFVEGQRIDETVLETTYKQTWRYLSQHREKLESRGQVRKRQLAWWQPERPRRPEHMLRPKIVSPHLVVVPRFSLDLEGKYTVSHAPFLYPRDDGAESDLLRYFAAILNSTPCYWYINSHAHTYRGGYTRIEPHTLEQTPVPNPTLIPAVIKKSLISLVDVRLVTSGAAAIAVERQIDRLVADLYGLTAAERRVLGMEV